MMETPIENEEKLIDYGFFKYYLLPNLSGTMSSRFEERLKNNNDVLIGVAFSDGIFAWSEETSHTALIGSLRSEERQPVARFQTVPSLNSMDKKPPAIMIDTTDIKTAHTIISFLKRSNPENLALVFASKVDSVEKFQNRKSIYTGPVKDFHN